MFELFKRGSGNRKGHPVQLDKPILSLEDWLKYAPPKSQSQIADDHSAKKLAVWWTQNGPPAPPEEFEMFIQNHPLTAGVTLTLGYAECTTGLRCNGGAAH